MTILRDPSTDRLLGGRPHRTAPGMAAGAFALVLLLGITALIVRGGLNDPQAVTPEAPPVPSVEATAARPPSVPSEVLELPQPTGYVDGVPVGYPRTTAGAIAAAYGYSRIASGLDIDATLRVIEAMADPRVGWFDAERAALMEGLAAQRLGLGLPAVGSPAAGSFTITPAGYQRRNDVTAPADFRVLTLNVVSATAADGTRTSGSVVLDWNLWWDGERWRVVAPYDGNDHDALAVAPLTAEARAAGWLVAHGG